MKAKLFAIFALCQNSNVMKEKLKFYKGFPKEGINFIDIIPFIQSRESFAEVIDALDKAVTAPNLAAPEARGFLFSTPLLIKGGSKVSNVIPMRKSGKLPFNEGDLIEIKIVKEYGFDKLYYRKSDVAAGVPNEEEGVFEVSILDDVLATGGTAKGVAESLQSMTIEKNGKKYGVRIKEFVFLVCIDELEGDKILEKIAPVTSLIHL